MKTTRICSFIILFIFLISSYTFPIFAAPVPVKTVKDNLSSSSILIDAARGQVLSEKNADQPTASSIMPKLMTALIVSEKAQMDSKVTISKNAAKYKGSIVELSVGNKYSVSDLLYVTLLSQSNNAAVALAEYVGEGDVGKFVDLMNSKCKELDLKDTFFKNPTGLDEEGQFTTARDISKLIKYAIANSVFDSVFGTKGVPWLSGNDSTIITNQNSLFWSYEGVDGGKIGTNSSGFSAVTTATRNNRRLIAVVSNTNEKSTLSDTINILDHGFKDFNTGILVQKNSTVWSITLEGNKVSLISKIDVFYTFPIGQSYIKNIQFKQNDKLKLPLTTDTVGGVVSYTLKDGTSIDVNLYPSQALVAKEDYKSKIKSILNQNLDLFMLVLILIIIECSIIIYRLFKLIIKTIRRLKN
jgi:D-alanyl-D-alanine carboxypeptidase/D-alanyl-D-alanine carboxypeptidase (penicillin-binding protein 5/6)